MGVVIMTTDVKSQLRTAKSNNTSIGEWCRGRLDAIQAFSEDDELRGGGWSAARGRLIHYTNYFQCLAYGADLLSDGHGELVRLMDVHLGDVIAQGYGSHGRIVEDAIIDKRDQALRNVNYFNDKLINDSMCSVPVIGPIFRASYKSKYESWITRLRQAEAALRHVADYKSSTALIYSGKLDAVNGALLSGSKALTGTSFDARNGTWGEMDESWMADLRNACDSGVSDSNGLRTFDGNLDEEKLKAQFQKPMVLWTEGETRAMTQAWEEAGKDAIAGDTSDLDTFLNSGYECVSLREPLEEEEWKENGTAGVDARFGEQSEKEASAHYRMSQGLEGFLTLYYLGSESKAAHQEDALSDEEYLLNGIACGMLMFGDDIVADSGEGGPHIRVSVDNEGTVEGTHKSFTYDQVSYGSEGNTFEVFRDGYTGGGVSKSVANYYDYTNYYNQRGIDVSQEKVDNYVVDYIAGKIGGRVSGAVNGAINNGIKALGPEAEGTYKVFKETYDFVEGYNEAQADLEAKVQAAQTEVSIQDATINSRHGVIVSNGSRTTVTSTSKNPNVCLNP